MKIILPTLFCLLLSVSATAQTAYPVFSIDSSLTENANAVVRLDKILVRVEGPKEMYIVSKRVVTVLNQKGQDAVEAYVYHDNDIEIKDLEAIVYGTFGNELEKFNKNDFKDKYAVSNGTLYSDSKFKYLNYHPTSFPYTIEISHTLKTENTATLPGFYFIGHYNMAVEKCEYVLEYDKSSFKINFKEKNFRDYDIKRLETPGKVVYSATNLLPIGQEAMGPSLSQFAPQVMVSANSFNFSGHTGTASDWDSFGQWMYDDILKGRSELPESTKLKMQELTQGMESPLEKAKRIYEYVQQNTRYISVQVGIGGIRPAPAIEVDRLKYGDCKGLSNYTRALLKSVGIPSYYCIVEAGQEKVDLEADFASLNQGNHIILAIPHQGDLHWIDCTSNSMPFGFLGNFTDGRRVLMLTPEGGKLVKTPAYLNKANYQKTIGNLRLDQKGNMAGEVVIKTNGIQYYGHCPISGLSQEDAKKYYKNRWDNIRNLKIASCQFNNDKDEREFVETLEVSAQNFATKAGSYLFFEPSSLNKNEYVPPRYPNREMPFHVSRGYFDEDSIKIEIPKGYKIESIPKAFDLETEFGSYRSGFSQINDSLLVFTKSLSIKAGKYPKEKYPDYRDFRKKIAERENMKISLVKIE